MLSNCFCFAARTDCVGQNEHAEARAPEGVLPEVPRSWLLLRQLRPATREASERNINIKQTLTLKTFVSS